MSISLKKADFEKRIQEERSESPFPQLPSAIPFSWSRLSLKAEAGVPGISL